MYNKFSNIYLEQFSVKGFTTLLVDSLVFKNWSNPIVQVVQTCGRFADDCSNIQFEGVSLGRCAVGSLTSDLLLKLDWMIGSTVCPII